MKTTSLTLFLLLISIIVFSQSNRELHFDGHDAIAFSVPIQMTGDFTLEFWAYLDATIGKEDRVFGGGAQEVHFPGGRLALSDNGSILIQGRTAVAPEAWHHYAIRRNVNGLQMFVDGVGVKTEPAGWISPLEVKLIGKKALKHGGFKGRLDEVRFWAIARSEDEIAANYATNITLNSKDFGMMEAYFTFNEAGGIGARDYTGNQPDIRLPDTLVRMPSSKEKFFTDNVGIAPVAKDRTIDATNKREVPLMIMTGAYDPDGILDARDMVFLSQPAYGELLTDRSDSVVIHLQFQASPKDFSTYVAPLKYNKQAAHSFTLDDGLVSAYDYVYPYLNGGVDGSGQAHSGKFYTDGCGNDIPFRADIGWNSANRMYQDLHIDTPGYLTWRQLVDLHNAGWCIMNHSYAHGSLKQKIGMGGSLQKNQSHVFAITTALGTPIWMKHQVLPSGERDFILPGFEWGLMSAHNENGEDFVGGKHGWRVDGDPDVSNLKLQRRNKNEHVTAQTIHEDLDSIMARSHIDKRYWYNDFTHGVAPGGSFGGLDFTVLKAYMDHLESQYGKYGADNLWMASTQEIYEYLFCRKYSPMTYRIAGKDVFITVDMNDLPPDFRWYDLTVAVDCPENFNVVSVTGAKSFTYKGTGPNKLVNFSLDQTETGEITRYSSTSTSSSSDQFSYAVRDKDGNLSAPATIKIIRIGELP